MKQKAEDIYHRFVNYEWNDVGEDLKKSILEAIEIALNDKPLKINKMENKKELNVKEYFLYSLLALCGFAVWYFGTAFVIMEMNPVKWSKEIRCLVVAEGLVTAVGIIILTHLSRK